jgi:hypothetical protein
MAAESRQITTAAYMLLNLEKICINCGTDKSSYWRFISGKTDHFFAEKRKGTIICNSCGLKHARGLICVICGHIYGKTDVKNGKVLAVDIDDPVFDKSPMTKNYILKNFDEVRICSKHLITKEN